MRMCMHSYGRQLVSQVYDKLEDIQPGVARKVLGGAVAGVALYYMVMKGYRYHRSRQLARDRGMAAKQARQNLKDYLKTQELKEGPVNREKEAMIVKLGMKDLQAKLQKGELKALEVLRAYQRKALEVTDRLNCVTEFVLEAEGIARALDLLKPEDRGPLHGIPLSVKESIELKGLDCNCGFTIFVGQPAEDDAVMVKLLKSLGAVPFARTNFPQGLLSYGCSNPIYGQAYNPYGHKRGPGGSSGGEGSLLGGGGSVIGLGSDIGGSVRIPANMCGAYSLKPTAERYITKGHKPILAGELAVKGIIAPMARDMDGLIELVRVVYNSNLHELDPMVIPVPFREEMLMETKPLRIGYYTTIKELPAHPACVRGVMEAKAALERKGHTLVHFEPPRAFDAFCQLWMTAVFGDGGEEAFSRLKDDVLDTPVRSAYYMGKLPLPVQYIVAKITSFVDPHAGKAEMGRVNLPKTVTDWWTLQTDVMAYKAEVYQAWKDQELDALLAPGFGFPAVTAGYEEYLLPAIIYTALFNLWNYPAGAIPVTKVTEQDLQRLKNPSVYPRSGMMEKFLVKDAEGSIGLPVGVQCVALPYEEERALRVMKDLDSAIRK